MHAAQKRTVSDQIPREYAVKTVSEGQFADAGADRVVAHGFRWGETEDEVAQMDVGIESTQVVGNRFHEDFVCALSISDRF